MGFRMTNDPFADRRRLTFEQAEGVEPLPRQLQPKELSKQLRALLWAFVHDSITRDVYDGQLRQWREIFYSYHILREHLMADEFVDMPRLLIEKYKRIFVGGNYVEVFGFLQFVLRHRSRPYKFAEYLDLTLSNARAAYRVLDGDTIIPVASDAERESLQRAFSDLAASEFRGARTHLHNAGSELTRGSFTSSIRESIHAVESVARTLEPSGKLSEALAKLEKSAAIHGGLKSGFLSIYGYTSDEQGIRHPLLDEADAKVDEADALFMIGACAAFVSYMIHKARLAGLLKEQEL
jgi:hypothetical protein